MSTAYGHPLAKALRFLNGQAAYRLFDVLLRAELRPFFVTQPPDGNRALPCIIRPRTIRKPLRERELSPSDHRGGCSQGH